jgi:hypothetical protein
MIRSTNARDRGRILIIEERAMTTGVHVRCRLCIGRRRVGRFVLLGCLRERIERDARGSSCPRRRANQECAASIIMLFHAYSLPSFVLFLIRGNPRMTR